MFGIINDHETNGKNKRSDRSGKRKEGQKRQRKVAKDRLTKVTKPYDYSGSQYETFMNEFLP